MLVSLPLQVGKGLLKWVQTPLKALHLALTLLKGFSCHMDIVQTLFGHPKPGEERLHLLLNSLQIISHLMDVI